LFYIIIYLKLEKMDHTLNFPFGISRNIIIDHPNLIKLTIIIII